MSLDSWNEKQENFLHFLRSHGAESAPYRVDLKEKKIFWVDEQGDSLVVADCRVLLSYALSNNSVMMGWANGSLDPGAAVAPVEGLEEVYDQCEPEDVWEFSMQVGDAVQAEALYRAPSPQSWVMLGLWNLRPGGEENFVSGSPAAYVRQVLDRLSTHAPLDELPTLLDNYAQSFLQMAGHPHKGSEYEDRLKDTAREVRNLLVFAQSSGENEGKLRRELARLRDEWG